MENKTIYVGKIDSWGESMYWNCAECGHELTNIDGVNFCPSCGRKITAFVPETDLNLQEPFVSKDSDLVRRNVWGIPNEKEFVEFQTKFQKQKELFKEYGENFNGILERIEAEITCHLFNVIDRIEIENPKHWEYKDKGAFQEAMIRYCKDKIKNWCKEEILRRTYNGKSM